MKLVKGSFILIFLLFCFLGRGNELGRTQAHSKGYYCQFGCEKVIKLNKTTFDSESTGTFPQKYKKRNRKGVKPVFICLVAENEWEIDVFDQQLNILNHTFYIVYKFPANLKRGPPSTLL